MSIDFTYVIPLLILEVIFFVYCLVKIIKNPVKYLPKWLWVILCLNVLGCILFLILGRSEEE